MKKAFKRALALFLCATMLVSVGAIGASAAELKTDCGGRDHSPVVILPGINHSPTYLYNEDNTPFLDADGNQVSETVTSGMECYVTLGMASTSAMKPLLIATLAYADAAAYYFQNK